MPSCFSAVKSCCKSCVISHTLEANIGDEVDPQMLKSVFLPFGDVSLVQMPPNPKSGMYCFLYDVRTSVNGIQPSSDGKHRGFAFVEYETVGDAQDAIDNLHLSELFGRVIKVSMSRPTRMQVNVSNPRIALWKDEAFLKGKAEFEATQLEGNNEDEDDEDGGDEVDAGAKDAAEPIAKKARLLSDNNPNVFFDIQIGGKPAGRIVILLRADVVPSAFLSASKKYGN